MAKGDSQNSQNAIDTQGGRAQNNLNNLWGQNTDRTTNFQNLFQNAVGQNQNNYSDIMGMFQSFLNPNNRTGSQGGGSVDDFVKQYQAQNPASAGKQGLIDALNKNGYNASQYMYGNTPSGNEISIGGQKYKVFTGDEGNNQSWYTPGTNDGPGGLGGMNQYGPAIDKALAGYGQFAENGGFSPQDIQNLRARAIAPTRAIYQSAQNNIDRQKALQGGYSPNYTAASAKLARDESSQIADANQNADAGIAQLQQQGKLYGLGGLANTGLGAYGQDASAFLGNQGQQLSNSLGMRGQNLGAINGATNLYGTTPGLTNMFGNQVLNSANQGIQMGGLQNQLANIIMQSQNQHAGIPGNFQSALGNISSLFGLGGQIGGMLSGFGG